ncbi:unnamed protein product [Owenia fusiformis]|uniref:Uncharacterized protein n=1 Tax=Owenia fusiformis TaxID=6347 RepID=A0A8J1XS60_OWEFU|nr:unnamed protein product [Owenia fusiformis]
MFYCTSASVEDIFTSGFIEMFPVMDREAELIAHRYRTLYNEEKMSDIKFTCGEDPLKQVIYGHKLILGAASDVFERMFYGGLKESQGIIHIPDISRDDFLEILRYIYCGEVQLTAENVLEILHGARKYLVANLEKQCWRYLNDNLCVENACMLLEVAIKFDEDKLKSKCLRVIRQKTDEIIKTESFFRISQNALNMILQLNVLNMASEIDVFRFVVRWAEDRCEELNSSKDGATMRETIGDALYNLRLLEISTSDLGCIVAPTGILQPQEVVDLLIYITAGSKNHDKLTKFSKEKRKYTIEIEQTHNNLKIEDSKSTMKSRRIFGRRKSSSSNMKAEHW